MKKNINNYLFIYLLILFSFAVFFLYQKHEVPNDSTISEWLINYEGGFTKRGLIGQLSIYLSNLFAINLRDSIFVLQILIIGIYFILIYIYLKNLLYNKIFIFAIFTPIFIQCFVTKLHFYFFIFGQLQKIIPQNILLFIQSI